jgi:D-alanyl-D-alanine dipeptidase
MRSSHFLLAMLVASVAPLFPANAEPPARAAAGRAVFDDPLVEITRACPGVAIELRYATARNITGKPIYPPGARAMLRRSVAERLNRAQQFVQDRGFALKVWDAYRPNSVQKLLWDAVRNPAYVVEPGTTGSLHGWGAAVDVTLVDSLGREVEMPTDFDAFTEAARSDYQGGDPTVAYNLSTLKRAMAAAGFRHIRDEWWHYSVTELSSGGPIEAPLVDPGAELARAEEPPKAAASPRKGKPRTSRPLFPPRPGETL